VDPTRIDAGQLVGPSFGVPVRRALPGIDRFILAFPCPSRTPIGQGVAIAMATAVSAATRLLKAPMTATFAATAVLTADT